MANPKGTPKNLAPPFSSTNQPDPSRRSGGRKPSVLKKYIKDNNLDAYDVAAAAKYILPKSREELGELIKDPKVPILIQAFARAVLQDFKKGNTSNVMAILDRAVGRPKQEVEHSGEIHLGMDVDPDAVV